MQNKGKYHNHATRLIFPIVLKHINSFLIILPVFLVLTHCKSPHEPIQLENPAGLTTQQIRDSIQSLADIMDSNLPTNDTIVDRCAKSAMAFAIITDDPEIRSRALLLLGNRFLKKHPDTSYLIYLQALTIADSFDLTNLKSTCYYNLGSILLKAFDTKQAIIFLDSAITIGLRSNKMKNVINGLNLLGTIHEDLGNLSRAKELFDSSFFLAQSTNNYHSMGVALNNLASFADSPDSIISLHKKALTYLELCPGAIHEMGVTYSNLGCSFTDPDSNIYYCKKAIMIGETYSFPLITISANNNLAYGYLYKEDLKRSEVCLLQNAIPLAKKINNIDWLATLYDSYADILAAKGDYRKAFQFMKESLYAREEASLQLAREQNRLLLSILEMKRKESLIQSQKAEIDHQSDQLNHISSWSVITILFLLSIIFLLLWLFQRNRMKYQREQIQSAKRIIEIEENEKGKTARELHDITGHLVMSIASRIEEIEIPDLKIKGEIKSTLNELSQSIRKISHRMNKAMMEHYSFDELVIGLCEDMQKLSGIIFQVEIPRKELGLPEEMVLHTYRIIQELIINAGKHAPGSHVKIGIVRMAKQIRITYEDNGPGFDQTEEGKRGIGILNIRERVKFMQGEARLESMPTRGTTWEIILPVKEIQITRTNSD